MRITKIKVNNFKSLVDFEIDLAKFNCIVGLNGSGKSTFLQFMSFLSQLMKGDIDEWFKRREWTSSDLYFQRDEKRSIEFSVEMIDDRNCRASWSAKFNKMEGCYDEYFVVGGKNFRTFYKEDEKSRYCEFSGNGHIVPHQVKVYFKYQGSIFSVLRDEDIPEEFYALRNFISGMESFDPLSPHFMRIQSKESYGSIGLEGENLSSFLHDIGAEKREELSAKLVKVNPHFSYLTVKLIKSDKKQLDIWEDFNGSALITESRHINDGMLRIIAVLAQIESNHPVIIFDEIENGINQELVEFLVKELVEAKQQIVVTTHSGLFLNYLDDDLARDSVQYFYKTPEGFTRCKKFFSIPSTAKKLGSLGPGEAVDDTNLYRLNEEIEQLDRNKEKGD